MARVVLVHGMAQSLKSADTLEQTWIPALAGGVRNAGRADLADRIWRDQRTGDVSVRMAFYGNLYRAPGSQGDGIAQAKADAVELEEQLARAWLEAAAERAATPSDRKVAQQAVTQLTTTDGAQGIGAAGSVALERLARIRWFTPAGFAFAQKFLKASLREVSMYLTDPAIRKTAQQRVLDHIGPDTQLVIGHSLGSVVAYEALHHTRQPVTLITFGSPLALRTIIYDRLEPQPPTIPASVTRWADFADKDDLIAVHTNVHTDFQPTHGTHPTVEDTIWVNNGVHAHDEIPYLTEPHLGQAVTVALQ